MKRIELTCKQGGVEWFRARLGKPTASHFADIVTPTGKAAANKGRDTYRNQLLAERMTGAITEHQQTDAMARGTALEPRGRAWYEMVTGRDVREVGFIERDDFPGIGGSPDGLCEDRGIEIKCPMAHTMIGQVLCDTPPADYMMQIQGNMWLAGFVRWDLVIFSDNPGVPSRIYEIEADAKLHAAFAEILPAFVQELAECEARLVALGGVKQAVRGSDEAYEATVESMGPLPDGGR